MKIEDAAFVRIKPRARRLVASIYGVERAHSGPLKVIAKGSTIGPRGGRHPQLLVEGDMVLYTDTLIRVPFSAAERKARRQSARIAKLEEQLVEWAKRPGSADPKQIAKLNRRIARLRTKAGRAPAPAPAGSEESDVRQ